MHFKTKTETNEGHCLKQNWILSSVAEQMQESPFVTENNNNNKSVTQDCCCSKLNIILLQFRFEAYLEFLSWIHFHGITQAGTYVFLKSNSMREPNK